MREQANAPQAVTVVSHVLGERIALVAEPAMHELYRVIERLARTQLPVLILGESGVGKEQVAAAVHAWSSRGRAQLVALNCAALQESLIESELFGYERGAFSGAVAAKAGLLERASGGTLFLDEVNELSAAAQAKLLRVLEVRRVTRLGGVRERAVDLRVVAATNRSLRALVQAGRFRNDLFFRLSGATVEVPPLRQRRAEIAALARYFAKEARLDEAALRCVLAYAWPGNVRELRHAMEYAAALADGGVISACHLPEVVSERDHGGRQATEPCRPVLAEGSRAHPRRPLSEARTDEGASKAESDGIDASEGRRGHERSGELEGRAWRDGAAEAQAPQAQGVERSAAVHFLPLAEELRALERRRMVEALHAAGGVQRRAAALLGMPVRTFTCKLAQYGLRSERL